MVTPRGKTERERGGGAARPKKSGGRSLLIPVRTDCPRRVSGGGGPPRRGGGYTRSPQAPALVLTQLGRPWKVRRYRLLPLVIVCAEEELHCALRTTEYNPVCKIVRQVCVLHNTESRRKTTCIKWRLLGLDKFYHG